MTYSKNSIWIDKEFKSYYNDSIQSGLRLHFKSDVDPVIKEKVQSLFVWLRKRYFFPYRCNIHFVNQEKFRSKEKYQFCQGIFFYPKESTSKSTPSIYIATDIEINDLYFTIFHELTHYFQWYFFEDEKRTDRSLEIEANKYADWLLYDYLQELQSKE